MSSPNNWFQDVRLPDDPRTKLWRYMDFAKFVSMLEYGGLFFPRLDKLGDSFEGTYTQANIKEHEEIMERLSPEHQQAYGISRRRYSAIREWMMVSCWHVNEEESAVMWQSYTKSEESICIQTTLERLRNCLDETVRFGLVQYEDYRTYKISMESFFYPVFHKRTLYQAEQNCALLFGNSNSAQTGTILRKRAFGS